MASRLLVKAHIPIALSTVEGGLSASPEFVFV